MDTVPPGTRMSALEEGRSRLITFWVRRLCVTKRLPLE